MNSHILYLSLSLDYFLFSQVTPPFQLGRFFARLCVCVCARMRASVYTVFHSLTPIKGDCLFT